MKRGADAERINQRLRRQSRLDILNLYKQWIETFGVPTQIFLGDVADMHEKFKSLILWRNPTATWRTITLLGILIGFVTFASPHLLWKTFFFFTGVVFFILLPLASHYPRYRRPLNPIWWALWGCPTDAQFAIHILRRRHQQQILAGAPAREADRAVAGMPINSYRPVEDPITSGVDAPIANELEELSAQDRKPRKLGSFFCQSKGVPGFLQVTTEGIYFVGVHQKVGPGHSHKSCKTSLREITDLIKTKSMSLLVWHSSGLQVKRSDGRSMFFSNMNHRDKAFNLILAAGSESEWIALSIRTSTSDPPSTPSLEQVKVELLCTVVEIIFIRLLEALEILSQLCPLEIPIYAFVLTARAVSDPAATLVESGIDN